MSAPRPDKPYIAPCPACHYQLEGDIADDGHVEWTEDAQAHIDSHL